MDRWVGPFSVLPVEVVHGNLRALDPVRGRKVATLLLVHRAADEHLTFPMRIGFGPEGPILEAIPDRDTPPTVLLELAALRDEVDAEITRAADQYLAWVSGDRDTYLLWDGQQYLAARYDTGARIPVSPTFDADLVRIYAR